MTETDYPLRVLCPVAAIRKEQTKPFEWLSGPARPTVPDRLQDDRYYLRVGHK